MNNAEPHHVIDDKFNPIRKGLLEFVLLKLISTHSVYVADILKILGQTEFTTREGTLYPLLSKMRREGLVNYEWKESETGPPRKYYELTKRGRAELEETDSYWQNIIRTIKNLEK